MQLSYPSFEVGTIEEQYNNTGFRKERPGLGYIEIEDLAHLLRQRKSKSGTYKDRNWRESYYFNFTDEKTGLSLITTIGILPNRGYCSGFVIILSNGRIALSKILFTKDIRWHETDRFRIKDISYRVEGIDWRLQYKSKECCFNILFRPLNEFYTYSNENAENFKRLFSQHIEQAGLFEGYVELNGEKMTIGPAPGHRDHSWGIRDWSSIDNYWLFSCTFGKDSAFNLWEGGARGNIFHEGYIFDSERNLKIISSEIKGHYGNKMEEPIGCEISVRDESGKRHEIRCKVICSVPIPMYKCIVYETIARMEYDNEIGFGLLERLVHDSNPFHKVMSLIALKKRSRRGSH